MLLATPSCLSEVLCVEALGQAGMWDKRLLMGLVPTLYEPGKGCRKPWLSSFHAL